MLYIIRDIILGLLVVIGVVEITRMIIMYFLRTDFDKDFILVVPIKGRNEQAEQMLHHAAARIMWTGGRRIEKVVCLDLGTDAETREICKKVCGDYPFMRYVSGNKKKET